MHVKVNIFYSLDYFIFGFSCAVVFFQYTAELSELRDLLIQTCFSAVVYKSILNPRLKRWLIYNIFITQYS